MEMIASETSIFIHLLFGFLLLEEVTSSSTTTTIAADTTTTTTAAETTTTTEAAATTTTLAPAVVDNCAASGTFVNASISPNFDYIISPGFGNGNYPNNENCRWYITAPNNYAVKAYFDNTTYAIERSTYCSYDYVIFYDGNSTTDAMLNRFCGFDRTDTTYRSSGTEMLIEFSSDYTLTYSGFRIIIQAVDNTYPGCTSGYPTYHVMYNREDNYTEGNYTFYSNISTPDFGISDYPTNLEMYWLFKNTNTTHYKIVLDIISISIERARGCIYDRLVLYDGNCTKDGILDTVCGNWAKQWDLNGAEYLLYFHSDFYLTRAGFLLIYYAAEKSAPAPVITSTTTFGPPVEAVIGAVKEMLSNYSTGDLPARDLSEPITTYIDFYFVGINGLDEVEQKMTSTGQFEVSWLDPSLAWDPTKRQGVVKILLPQDDVWKPDIALMNGFEKITAMGAKFMFIDVDYNGSCIWKPYQIMESVCKVDMTHYPYDRQICILKFGTWSTDDSEVITELGTLGLQFHTNFQENAEWRLISTETRQEDNNSHKVVEFFLTLERNSLFVTYYMTVPIIMLAYMNVLTFVVPCVSGEKTGYSITLFLSFVVLLIINNDSLPDNSDTISLYAAYVLTMTILSALALIISVLQIKALTFEERKYPLPDCLKSMINSVNRIKSYLPCRHVEKQSKQKPEKKVKKESDHEKTGKEHDALKLEATESGGSSGYGSSTSDKKRTVAFKLDNEDNDALDNYDTEEPDRFSFPRKREISQITIERETTLFEKNAFIRTSTSSEIHLFTTEKARGLDSTDVNSNAVDDKNETVPDPKHESGAFEVASHEFDEEKTDDKTMERDELEGNTRKTENDMVNNIVSESKTFGSADKRDSVDKIHAVNTEMGIDQNSLEKDPHLNAGNESNNMMNYQNSQVSTYTEITSKYRSRPNVSAQDEHLQVTNHNQPEQYPKLSNTEELFRPLEEDMPWSNTSKEVEEKQFSNDDSPSYSNTLSKFEDEAKQEAALQNLDSKVYQVKNIGQESGSLIDEIAELQPVSVNDVKMNRPISSTENRPQSVHRLLSAGDRGIASASHGRALSGATSRPVSTRDDRTVSVFSPRPISILSRKRSTSAMSSQKDNTVLLFGSEEPDRKTPTTNIDNESDASDDHSGESIESSSMTASSDESDGDDTSWTDLVSCTDVIFFIIYLFITTLMSLAMFMTMVKAY